MDGTAEGARDEGATVGFETGLPEGTMDEGTKDGVALGLKVGAVGAPVVLPEGGRVTCDPLESLKKTLLKAVKLICPEWRRVVINNRCKRIHS